jgi:hypothetical protein
MCVQVGEDQCRHVMCVDGEGLQKVLGLVDCHGVGLVMTSLEDTVLVDAVEFTVVGGAALEFCSADAFSAIQVFMLTSMACNARQYSRLVVKGK